MIYIYGTYIHIYIYTSSYQPPKTPNALSGLCWRSAQPFFTKFLTPDLESSTKQIRYMNNSLDKNYISRDNKSSAEEGRG